MGLVQLIYVSPAHAPFFTKGFDAALIGAQPGLALKILKQFSKT